MLRLLILSLIVVQNFIFCSPSQDSATTRSILADSITKIEMNLSAFGVESDNFPSIEAYIDFVQDSSNCVKSYYNPDFKRSSYNLSSIEMKKVLELLRNSDFGKLKNEYKVSKTDQPTSTTVIYTGNRKFVIKDYGLEGEYPLKELYKIVYKF